jgi:ribonuclease P protein component
VSALASEKSSSEPGRPGKYPRSVRLLRHGDFERVYEQGQRHFSPHMTVFFLGRDAGAGLRVGFTVSRALGGAVDRNRMKRRLREAVRLRRPPARVAVDVVVNPKRSLLTVDFETLLNEIARAFEKIQRKLVTNG